MAFMLYSIDEAVDCKYIITKAISGQAKPGTLIHVMDTKENSDGVQREHGQFVYSLNGKITKRQADKLFDLGLYKNTEVQKLINDCEGRW